MPQLDKVTFFTQVTWALFGYFTLYLVLSCYVCPAVATVLKVRNRLDLGSTSSIGLTKGAFLSAKLVQHLESSRSEVHRVSDCSHYRVKADTCVAVSSIL